ncbi:MAG: MBL fold metallo-hydrolase [Sphingobacteriales bacterium]|nr:MBL fold metallo-hydrolase [Sphingobacteriales bacterium]
MFCPELRIRFLGTGTSSGVPMIACQCDVCESVHPHDNRLRSSILVESDTTSIVIDTTPDFRTQMLREKVNSLDAVLFTHPHKDHIAGLDDVKAFNYFQQKPMKVYANELTQAALHKEFSYVFAQQKYPGIPDIQLQDIGTALFHIGDIPVQPILVWHLKMPVLGFRFGAFTYITDANHIELPELEKIKGSKIMVLNALRKEKHISHYNLSEAIDLVKELKVPEAYFTHISHQMGKHEEVNAELPDGIRLAHDGMLLKLS